MDTSLLIQAHVTLAIHRVSTSNMGSHMTLIAVGIRLNCIQWNVSAWTVADVVDIIVTTAL